MSAVWNALRGGGLSRPVDTHLCSSAGASGDQSCPANAGYQPKNASEIRQSSAPPTMDKWLINAPTLVTNTGGEAAVGTKGEPNTRRKRCASMNAEGRHVLGRPPRAPSTGSMPLTPEFVGTDVNFPSVPNSQSPPSGTREGHGGTEFYDVG